MRTSTYIRSSLAYYWRTNLAVVLAVATTVAVLVGALLVGDSVRASLHDLVLLRLGNTAYVIAARGFFREKLADDLQSHARFNEGFPSAAPLIALEGIVTHEQSRRRGTAVQVYGVDERFWKFHGRDALADVSADRGLLVSPGLAEELGAEVGDTLLVRLQKPFAVPVESLHGRKVDLGRTIRLSIRAVLSATGLGEFSLRPRQGAVRAVFVPLRRLQRDLKQEGKVNTILVSEAEATAGGRGREVEELLRETFSLSDLGLQLRILARQRALSLESDRILIEDRIAEAARAAAKSRGMQTTSIFTYLANTIRAGGREIPYSLVTAIAPSPVGDLGSPLRGQRAPPSAPPIWLNAWAFRDLGAGLGDEVTLEYYLWEEDGRLRTETAQFELRGSLPMEGIAGDSQLAPQYPGITDSDSVSDWDPPFPIELNRVRPRDEDYWDQYGAASKAFILLEAGQQLWRSRFGKLTALRLSPASGLSLPATLDAYQEILRGVLDPLQTGFTVVAVRAEGAEASRGAVNFGEYFVYFSFFIVVSAVLLTGLFFKLGVEQRLREIGLLEAVGFPRARIGALFLAEGIVLAVVGSLVGLAGAVGYGWLMMLALRTWWVGAVGTTYLDLHVLPASLALGGLGGILAALLSILWTLRGLRAATPRNLLTGTQEVAPAGRRRTRSVLYVGVGATVLGFALLFAALGDRIGQVAGFFGSGSLLLVALVCFQWVWLSRRRRRLLAGAGLLGLSRLGLRNATWRPGRSLLCIALIASATFIIVAVDAFRREEPADRSDPKSGTGGFPLLAESLLPIPYNLDTDAGRQDLNLSDRELSALESVQFTSFRLRPGEDVSCLNLYRPRNPKILAAPSGFIASGRFAFQDSLARTPEERQNPWRLLEADLADGAIPAIADANSMTYVLHLGLGDDFVLNRTGGEPVRLRLVAALSDSIFQGELLVSEENFLRVFPHQQGYRFFLLDVPPPQAGEVAVILEEGLYDSGFDVVPTGERLAGFHRVENTYLSTFQALGGLGLLLGTFGLGAVLLRNVLERRRELALLRAVGYRPAHLAWVVVTENALLLACGLVSGIVSALLAIAPALSSRGGVPPAFSLGVLLAAVLLTGLAASLLAVWAVVRAPLLPALRAE